MRGESTDPFQTRSRTHTHTHTRRMRAHVDAQCMRYMRLSQYTCEYTLWERPTSRFTLHAIHLRTIAAVCVRDCPAHRRCVKGYFTMPLTHARVLDAEVALCCPPHRVFQLLRSHVHMTEAPTPHPPIPRAANESNRCCCQCMHSLRRSLSVSLWNTSLHAQSVHTHPRTHARTSIYTTSPQDFFIPHICTLFLWKDPR